MSPHSRSACLKDVGRWTFYVGRYTFFELIPEEIRGAYRATNAVMSRLSAFRGGKGRACSLTISDPDIGDGRMSEADDRAVRQRRKTTKRKAGVPSSAVGMPKGLEANVSLKA